MPRYFRWISLIILLNLLIACSVLPNSQNQANSEEIAPVQQQGLNPKETVEAFLTAWNGQNYEAMYGLLSPRSAEIYAIEDFRAQYTTTHTDLGFSGVSYEIHSSEEQGTSAAISYDVTLNTSQFGDITDEGRIMRLVQQNGVWSVAWSPMDIINGMTANVRLDSNRRFPPRGNIYDRNGLPLVSENGSTVALYLRISDMRNQDDCTNLLASIMLRPVSYFNALYVDYQTADSVFFVGEIDSETYNRYSADLNSICGTDIQVEGFGSKIQTASGRTYFGDGAATHITGYLGRVSNADFWENRGYSTRDLVGGAGVEFAFMDDLAGKPEVSLRLIDSSNVTLRELGSSAGSPSYPVTLTIDRELQWNTAKAFGDAWAYAAQNWVTRATGGAAVVMDVNSGAVLAMFSYPTYDPRIWYPDSTYYLTNTDAGAVAQIDRAYKNDPFLPLGPAIQNRAFTEQYAPGSTFKIFSALAAADAGIWQADEQFDCTLTWDGAKYGDTSGIREDWRVVNNEPAAGLLTLSQALTTSCNPFFWETGAKMFQRDPNLLYNYATQFGLGQPTGLVGLSIAEVEASGNIPQPGSMDEALNDVIGQGNTSVTAIQMAQMVSAVANGGTVYRPYLVQQVGGADGTDTKQTFEPEVVGNLGVSEQALALVQQGMCQVPIDRNLGTSYWIFAGSRSVAPSYSSCGKTGTAQAINAPNAWYVAYAPADNPQIAIAVVVPNSREGSEVAAPIARRIMDHYFNGPIADYPAWWPGTYNPVELPRGVG